MRAAHCLCAEPASLPAAARADHPTGVIRWFNDRRFLDPANRPATPHAGLEHALLASEWDRNDRERWDHGQATDFPRARTYSRISRA